MRTTTKQDWKFVYGISDIGRLLFKSPVTLRKWESDGFVSFPRDPSGDRTCNTADVRRITELARDAGRISRHRANLVLSLMTLVEQIEYENNTKAKK